MTDWASAVAMLLANDTQRHTTNPTKTRGKPLDTSGVLVVTLIQEHSKRPLMKRLDVPTLFRIQYQEPQDGSRHRFVTTHVLL